MFERSAEVEDVVREYFAARNDRDVATLSDLHSTSEQARVIGSDVHEWYSGHDDVVAIQRVHWEEQPRSVMDLLRLEAFSNGETGWAAADMEISSASGDTFRARQTIVLAVELGQWKITQVHFSIPVANEVVGGVELTRTLSDLLNSIDNGDGSLPANRAVTGTATIMFTDIVDSTVRAVADGDAVWSELVSSHFAATQRIVEANGGSVVKTLGDGGMYVFPTGAAAL